MNLDLFNINHNLSNLEKGNCLISEPFSPDSYFGRSVVLITEHKDDEGTMGYILNKPIDLKIKDLFSDYPDFDAPCYIGGPVSPDTIHYIHNRIDLLPDSLPVTDDIYWGGKFDNLKELIENKEIKANEIKFFLGYSGWSPDQILQEIEDKFWIVSEIDPNHLMKKNDNIWKDLLNEKGESYALWASSPTNPGLN